MRTKANRQRGFTLLEVLVAFVIAALALAVLFHGAVGGLRTTSAAGGYEEALSRARSRLAAVGAAPLPGELQGDDGGGFHWHTRVTPIGTAAGQQPQAMALARLTAPQLTLYRVSVAVSWKGDGGNRVVELDSERLGATAAGAR
ncbi:MAG: prepilin-type N-terminal cleavage/methylation domain-containing protein [Acidisphaera sp.]|nr:prepilin-type N-terminal cleavage/methylation domain-containing protein [Acidisphaera sp.]